MLWFVLAMLIVVPLMGFAAFGARTGSWKLAVASLVRHLVYGVLLGGVYVREL